MPKTVNIDLRKLEEMAARGLSQKDASAELGVKYLTLTAKLSRNNEVKAAWQRGMARSAKSSDRPVEEAGKAEKRSAHKPAKGLCAECEMAVMAPRGRAVEHFQPGTTRRCEEIGR